MLTTLINKLTKSSPVKTINPVLAMNKLIDEIHETFYTEVERLLAEANVSKSEETTKQDLLAKRERLQAMGFTKTKEMKEADEELERIHLAQQENKEKAELIKAINYFSFKYPMYKFITEESVQKICEKYHLIYGSVDLYTGEVPDENLKHIENFKINAGDELYIKQRAARSWRSAEEYLNYTEFEEENRPIRDAHFYRPQVDFDSFLWQNRTRKAPLEIAAPQKDFDLESMEVNNFKISPKKPEVLDPVVLKPVFYNRNKYYLIVTAWGQEATDELVLNPVHN